MGKVTMRYNQGDGWKYDRAQIWGERAAPGRRGFWRASVYKKGVETASLSMTFDTEKEALRWVRARFNVRAPEDNAAKESAQDE